MFAPYANNKMDRRLLARPQYNEPQYASKSAPQLPAQKKSKAGDNVLSRRVLSAKDQKLKMLQNQLSDAHNHIREISTENRILRTMQKRMDSALQKYEGSEADIPKLLNGHFEEIRFWKVKHKKLKEQLRDTSDRLKVKETEYQKLYAENKRLSELTSKSNLGERENLQMEINILNEKLKKANESVSLLHRKFLLESKSNTYRLQSEILKHKETEKKLKQTQEDNEKLTELIRKYDRMTNTSIAGRIYRKNNKSRENISQNQRKTKESTTKNHLPDLTMKKVNTEVEQVLVADVVETTEILSTSNQIDNEEISNEIVERIDENLLRDKKIHDISEKSHEEVNLENVKNMFENTLKINTESDQKLLEKLEEKSALERNLLENLIDNYCNDLFQNVLQDHSSEIKDEKPKSNSNKQNGISGKKNQNNTSEVNNNSKNKLDEDKKRKLLATLNAIDSGEIDDVTIRSNFSLKRDKAFK